mgnify:CR=1 FL=1
MATTKKIETVVSLSEKLNKATSVTMTNYQGLTHKRLEELRKILKKHQAEFVITKNTLLLRALGGFLNQEKVDLDLSGQTATLFAYEDEITPLKEMLKFAKSSGMPSLKAGFLKTTKMSVEDLNRLVKLPARPALLAQLVGQLKAPIYGLHRSLNWNLQKLVFALSAIQAKKVN